MEILKVIESSFTVLTDFEEQAGIYYANENLARKLAKSLDKRFHVIDNEDYFITFVGKNHGVVVVSFDYMNSTVKVTFNTITNGREEYQMRLAGNTEEIAAWLKVQADRAD